jgi:hypothetical protein
MQKSLRKSNPLQAPYIKVDATVIQAGEHNGKPNIKPGHDYVIAPSAKKIATYIVNQIFGSELVTQTEGLSVSWLMPSLKEVLELGIYETEGFVYINRYNDKIYLECLKPCELFDVIQIYDKFISGTIIQDYDINDEKYTLKRHIEIKNGYSYIECEAYKRDGKDNEIPIQLEVFNNVTGNEYLPKYALGYEVIINIDLGQDFFKDSKKFLLEEMRIINVLNDEIEKTRTRIVTTQHYQTNDVLANWSPASNYSVNTLTVKNLQDYFTLLPGDKEHQMFEFLQGDVRFDAYINSFKFCDYQVIQMAGLSPANFGYEKDSYVNTDNINLSKNNSEMTIEAIKSQIEPQIDNLIVNIIKAQKSNNIIINELAPNNQNFIWNYGANEKYDDMKKLQVMNRIQSVGAVPYEYKAKIIYPIIEKLIDGDYDKGHEKEIKNMIDKYSQENKDIDIKFSEE